MVATEMNSGMRASERLNRAATVRKRLPAETLGSRRNHSLTVAARTSVTARTTGRRRALRSFTLIEMLVSLGVLAVALTVVGVVFDVTVKTVSQAAAISELHAVLRQFLIQLDADLSAIEPSQSVLIISGRTQRAARDADDLAAGASWRVLTGNPNDPRLGGYDPRLNNGLDPGGQYSNPRTDILSFITSRPMVSKAPATSDPNDPYLLGAKGSPVQVVYGHAALAEVDASGTWFDRHIHRRRPFFFDLPSFSVFLSFR